MRHRGITADVALLARNGLYARLWAHQSGGFLTDDVEDEAIAVDQPATQAAIEQEVDRAAAQRPEEASRIGHELPTGSDPITR